MSKPLTFFKKVLFLTLTKGKIVVLTVKYHLYNNIKLTFKTMSKEVCPPSPTTALPRKAIRRVLALGAFITATPACLDSNATSGGNDTPCIVPDCFGDNGCACHYGGGCDEALLICSPQNECCYPGNEGCECNENQLLGPDCAEGLECLEDVCVDPETLDATSTPKNDGTMFCEEYHDIYFGH